MTTPPLLDLPSSACVANVVMSLERAVGITESPFTFEEQAFQWEGERWLVDFELPPITSRAIAADWQAWGVKIKGTFGRFLMGDPSARIPRGVATGTPVVKGANQVGETLITDGWTINTNGIMLKGDYFQLGTGASSRLYMLTEDVNSNGSGEATLSFGPALRSSPSDDAPLVVTDAKGVFRLTENVFPWSVQPGKVWRFSFSAIEVVNA